MTDGSESRLSVRERFLHALLGSATDQAIIALNADGVMTAWNAGACTTLGWTEAEALGQPDALLFTPEDRAAGVPQSERDAALRHGRRRDERWHLHQDGSRVWLTCELMPLHDEAGAVQGFVRVMRGPTAERKAAEAQQADAEFMRSVLESSGDCIKVLDLQGRLLFMSAGGQRIMEVDDFGAIRGCPWPGFWQGERHADAMAAVAAAAAGGMGRFQGEACTMAGNPRWWDVQVTPIAGPDGRPDKLLAVSRDITAARASAEALREAQGLNTLILNSSRDCIVVLDLEGHTLFVSPGGIESMDIADVGPLLGLSWLRVWTGADQAAAQGAMAVARAGGTGRFEGFCATHKGRPKWWDVVISPLPGADGQPERLVSVGRDITGRKLADDQARRLASLVEQSTDFIGMADPEGRVQFVNQAGLHMVGLPSLAAARQASIMHYVPLPDRAMLAEQVLPALRRGESWEGEVNFRNFATGASLPVLYHTFPLRDAQGGPIGYGTVTRDLRELRRAGALRLAVLELGERLRDMADVTAMSAVAAEILGNTLGVSRAGFGKVDAAGETLAIAQDWTAPGVRSLTGTLRFRDFGSYVDDLRRGETVVLADAALDPRAAGSTAALRGVDACALVNVPILEGGAFVALCFAAHAEPRPWPAEEVEFIRNVADRTQAAIQRRHAEERLRAFAASLERQVAERTADRNRLWQLSADIMLVARFDGVITAVNPAWTIVLGWAEDELVGRSMFELIHPDDREQGVVNTGMLAQGHALRNFDRRYRHKDGSYRWITWTATPGDGLINAVGRDTTAEKQKAEALRDAEERLRQSQKMEAVGQLTGGLAHDFNNLLTGISGSLELIKARVAQGRAGELGRYIAAAQGASERAAALTHRLLAFSRRQTLAPRAIQPNRLVEDMEELIQRTVGPQVQVGTVLAAGLWTTLCDPNQLENALLNLAINSRDAMPGGGRLTIETANVALDERAAHERDMVPGQYVALRVSDTGAGMPPAVLARAFDPFFTTKPLGQGTGLGLSMIYGFAKQSGGQARITSEEGQGVTVRIYLPRHLGPADEGAPPAAPAEAPRARGGETVLIVDDEPTVRMLVGDVLGELGYTALEAADGASGLRMLQSGMPIDLLITDVGLPGGMNGRQMADAARVVRPGLKVLFITGYAENAALGDGRLEPGMQVMTKPFLVEALASRVKALIAAP